MVNNIQYMKRAKRQIGMTYSNMCHNTSDIVVIVISIMMLVRLILFMYEYFEYKSY